MMTRSHGVSLAFLSLTLLIATPRLARAKEATTQVCVSVRLRTASSREDVAREHHPKTEAKKKATKAPPLPSASQPKSPEGAGLSIHDAEDPPPSRTTARARILDDHTVAPGHLPKTTRVAPHVSPRRGSKILPLGQRPQDYLRRLIEYFVTHQRHFEAVKTGCKEHIDVDLYPLRTGWTVFARYSGHQREEWLVKLHEDELSQFAERVVLALLEDRPISTTIKRDTVLRADSVGKPRTIAGSHHVILTLGTQVRMGQFSTARDDGYAEKRLRIFSPMTISGGYRGRFQNWGIAATSHLGINASRTAIAHNDGGGHIDFGGTFGASLHFLLYTAPRGVTSFYFGGGSTFEVLWYSVIKEKTMRTIDNRSTLVSGGLDVDLVVGYEFMRTSSVQFLLQAEVNLPAYAVHTENDDGGIATWFPGVSLQLGVMF